MMNFTQDEIAAVVGTQQLEIIALRREIMKLRQEIAKKEAPNVEELKKDGTTGS